MATTEERVARLEAGYDHLATKADLENLGKELGGRISSLESKMAWRLVAIVIGLTTLGMTAGMAAVAAVIQVVD